MKYEMAKYYLIYYDNTDSFTGSIRDQKIRGGLVEVISEKLFRDFTANNLIEEDMKLKSDILIDLCEKGFELKTSFVTHGKSNETYIHFCLQKEIDDNTIVKYKKNNLDISFENGYSTASEYVDKVVLAKNNNQGQIDRPTCKCDICSKEMKGTIKYIAVIDGKKMTVCEQCLANKKRLGKKVDILSQSKA